MDEKEGLKQFGANIRKLRVKNKLTQAQLAEKIGFSTNYVGMIERAERDTNLSNAYKFARVFGVEVFELFK